MKTVIFAILITLSSCSAHKVKGEKPALLGSYTFQETDHCGEDDTDSALLKQGYTQKQIDDAWQHGDKTGDYGIIDAAN